MKEQSLKEQIAEIKDKFKMKENRGYTQEDAEFMADWFNAVNSLYTGMVSSEIKKEFEQADKIRVQLHQQVFSDNSPWAIQRGRKGQAEVYYKG